MIFVTVGTHEQPFNRLIEYVDKLKQNKVIGEEVIMQTGYSTYEPLHCTWQKVYPYGQMVELVREARIVVTHGGPSSFILPLQIGKVPIVIPRQKKFGEHVNDHQVNFARAIADRMKSIIVVSDIERLQDIINDYEELVKTMNGCSVSNNARFNEELRRIVNEMLNDTEAEQKG